MGIDIPDDSPAVSTAESPDDEALASLALSAASEEEDGATAVRLAASPATLNFVIPLVAWPSEEVI